MYKHSLDLIFYLVADQDEERADDHRPIGPGLVEKSLVLENLDLVLLCLDETIDEGCSTHEKRLYSLDFPRADGRTFCSVRDIIVETDSTTIAS